MEKLLLSMSMLFWYKWKTDNPDGKAPAIVWTVDTNMMITSSHGPGLSSLGLRPNQLVEEKANLYDYLGSRDPEFIPLKVHLEALKGKSTHYPATFGGRNFQTMVTPNYDDQGNISGCTGVAVDVTDDAKPQTA